MAEKWHLKGEFAAACICNVTCPCNLGQQPSQGHCAGAGAFDIRRGKYGKIDLSGVRMGMAVSIPGFAFDGNWEVAFYVDESASDEQNEALEKILLGQAGGPFAQLHALISEVKGVKKVPIVFKDGIAPSFQIGTQASVEVEPILGVDQKTPVRLLNGLFTFRDNVRLGKTSSRFVDEDYGWDFTFQHAESEEFDFSEK